MAGNALGIPCGAVAERTQGLNKKIADLKAAQNVMLAERQKVAKDLRNTERKRRRLKERARMLTDEDLMAVLRLRKEKKEMAAAAGASPSHVSTSTGSAAPTGSSSASSSSTPAATVIPGGVTAAPLLDHGGIGSDDE